MKKREPSVTIPADLYRRMAIFCIEPIARTPENEEWIRKGVIAKMERDLNHQLYTTYKSGVTEEEREKARQEYLDRMGIHPDWRW